jgi:hypothetical protein
MDRVGFCTSSLRHLSFLGKQLRPRYTMSPSAQVTMSTDAGPLPLKIRSHDTYMNGLSSVDGSTNSIGRGALIEGIPKFDDPYKHRQWVLERLAGAFRVMARKGYLEGTAGHISVRDPVDPDSFWINSSVNLFRINNSTLRIANTAI